MGYAVGGLCVIGSGVWLGVNDRDGMVGGLILGGWFFGLGVSGLVKMKRNSSQAIQPADRSPGA